MKRTLLLSFALMLGLVAYQNASSTVIPTALSRLLSPIFKWKSTEHNFGKIPQNKPVTTVFEFTNTGDAPIIITNATGSCGCTVPNYSTAPVLAGQTGEVSATFNAATVGSFTKTVTVQSNVGSPITLTITGEVVAAGN